MFMFVYNYYKCLFMLFLASAIIHCPINKWFCGEVYGCYDASSFCFHNRIGNYHCAYNCSGKILLTNIL